MPLTGGSIMRVVAFVGSTVLVMPLSTHAQARPMGTTPAGTPGSACSYAACALVIIPRWNGLAVVRSTNGPGMANLNFFWPRSVTAALRGGAMGDAAADSAAAHAQHALGLRRAGAAFTDLGMVAVAVVAARVASNGGMSGADKVAAGAGLASLAISVPLQFGADGELSRAVWWHNLRYVR